MFELCCGDPISYVSDLPDTSLLAVDDDSSVQTSASREKHEVRGWTLDAAARGVVIMGAAVFVSTALLKSAKEAAGCSTSWVPNDDDTFNYDVRDDCNEKIFGMKPTSLLTNIVMISSLVSASLMPLIGSIIDHTPYRRTVGRISAALLVSLVFIQILALKKVWAVAAAIQVAVSFLYSVHLCAVYAYLPELTSNTETLVAYTSRFTAAQYMASVAFLLTMVSILRYARIGAGEEILAAQVSQATVFVVATVFFGVAWFRFFHRRKACQSVPEGMTLLNAGFRKLFRTAHAITLHHNSLKWFLVSASLTQSATTTFSSIAITFMTDQLEFGATENAIAILLLLVFAVPGTSLAHMLATRLNPLWSLRCCLCLWMVTTGIGACVLQGRGQALTAYGFAVLWGTCLGWVYPTEKAFYCSIIPGGQDAELMGVYIFACQILSWLPPLVFTAMNEAGFSMRAGLFSLNGYFFFSYVVLTFFVGDYDDAVEHARTFHAEKDADFVILPDAVAMKASEAFEAVSCKTKIRCSPPIT